MSNIIQDAKELLDGATPGPWYPHEDDWDDNLVVNKSGENKDWGDQLIIEVKAGDLKHDRRLIAAAPALAEIVASLTTEYIAEWQDNGVWAPIEMDGFDGTFANLRAAQGYIEVAKKQAPYEITRIVRRLVSAQEVVG